MQGGTQPLIHPIRVRRAQRVLLDNQAESLAVHVRNVLCEATRSQIVRALTTGPLPVGDLAHVVRRDRPAISRHLRVLRDEIVVTPRRRGRMVYYSLTDAPVALATLKALDAIAELAS